MLSEAGYLSGGGSAMDGAFFGGLIYDGDSRSKGGLGIFCRLFIDGGPDVLNDVLYPSSV